jgi:hypothetical protein
MSDARANHSNGLWRYAFMVALTLIENRLTCGIMKDIER